MHFYKIAVLALFPLIGNVLSAPPRRQSTAGTIVSPADGTVIAPGAAFDFDYETMADYGVSSYNYTVWLLTSPMPASLVQSNEFAQGHYFGRFAEPNYPGNPNPPNLAPAQLIMPDFSKNPGGFGTGESDSNGNFALMVIEEYATGVASVGSRFNLAINTIVYNTTTS
ncbi:hypothetical protein DFH07DRAFT_423328 [Mycena maculata]|uniref:Uncharacterized protein n=1 Tax=Mycena maculata TaxID=230809 RepID=A0AAD7JBY6_9AGAR|nr:hypothetical protein DFH07DRAFT_423328 [Mycena maculata]